MHGRILVFFIFFLNSLNLQGQELVKKLDFNFSISVDTIGFMDLIPYTFSVINNSESVQIIYKLGFASNPSIEFKKINESDVHWSVVGITQFNQDFFGRMGSRDSKIWPKKQQRIRGEFIAFGYGEVMTDRKVDYCFEPGFTYLVRAKYRTMTENRQIVEIVSNAVELIIEPYSAVDEEATYWIKPDWSLDFCYLFDKKKEEGGLKSPGDFIEKYPNSKFTKWIKLTSLGSKTWAYWTQFREAKKDGLPLDTLIAIKEKQIVAGQGALLKFKKLIEVEGIKDSLFYKRGLVINEGIESTTNSARYELLELKREQKRIEIFKIYIRKFKLFFIKQNQN